MTQQRHHSEQMLKEEVGILFFIPWQDCNKIIKVRYVKICFILLEGLLAGSLLYVPAIVEEYCYKVVMLEMSPTI